MAVDSCAALHEKFGLRACVGLDGCQGRPTLFRSRALTDATADDVATLRSLGIEVVYDLRKEAERLTNPEPAAVCEAFEVRTCPVDLQDDAARTQETKSRHVKAAYGKPGERMLFLYGVMADHADAVRDIVAAIVRDSRPALVHCANGKDRVGVVCASTQLVCGVSREAVMTDYLLTNECNAEMNKRDLAHYAGLMPPDAVEVLAAMFEAREEYLRVFINAVEKRFGSFDEWVEARPSYESIRLICGNKYT